MAEDDSWLHVKPAFSYAKNHPEPSDEASKRGEPDIPYSDPDFGHASGHEWGPRVTQTEMRAPPNWYVQARSGHCTDWFSMYAGHVSVGGSNCAAAGTHSRRRPPTAHGNAHIVGKDQMGNYGALHMYKEIWSNSITKKQQRTWHRHMLECQKAKHEKCATKRGKAAYLECMGSDDDPAGDTMGCFRLVRNMIRTGRNPELECARGYDTYGKPLGERDCGYSTKAVAHGSAIPGESGMQAWFPHGNMDTPQQQDVDRTDADAALWRYCNYEDDPLARDWAVVDNVEGDTAAETADNVAAMKRLHSVACSCVNSDSPNPECVPGTCRNGGGVMTGRMLANLPCSGSYSDNTQAIVVAPGSELHLTDSSQEQNVSTGSGNVQQDVNVSSQSSTEQSSSTQVTASDGSDDWFWWLMGAVVVIVVLLVLRAGVSGAPAPPVGGVPAAHVAPMSVVSASL